jgi:hypothetical protein
MAQNAAPVITTVTGPTGPVTRSSPAFAQVTFTDAGVYDTHTCQFAWGDGFLDTVSPDGGTCTSHHVYDTPGVYALRVTVTDDDGGTASAAFEYVVVYDPEGGFVTGGGTIDSPAGAYIADASLSGRASFGFVSKYERGATLPTGQTQFQFRAAGFNFHGAVYDWLVVAGARAQYKGTGTVNGAGAYGFLITVRDGERSGGGGVDGFRLKVWDKATGAIVYDNGLGAADDLETDPQAIAAGSIVIHPN